jgi:hypothetical protein
VSGAAGAGDDHFQAAVDGARREFRRQRRRPVRRHDVALVRDAEFGEDGIGLRHRVPVRLAAHDDGY